MYAQPKIHYLLFNKNELNYTIFDNIDVNQTYVEIEHKDKKLPNHIIYNYNFTPKNLVYGREGKKYIYQQFKQALTDPRQIPYEIVVSITPLTKENHNIIEVTDKILNKEITPIDQQDFFRTTVNDLFYGIYSPLGLFDTIPEVNTKRLDIRIIVKNKNKYYLYNETTLTEIYYVDLGYSYGNESTCCALRLNTQSFDKKVYANISYPMAEGVFPDNGIYLQSIDENFFMTTLYLVKGFLIIGQRII